MEQYEYRRKKLVRFNCKKSYFENLNFPSDRYWYTGRITIVGKNSCQDIVIAVYVDNNKVIDQSYRLDKNETKTLSFNVDGYKSISVSGNVNKAKFRCGASADVKVEVDYDDSVKLESKCDSWGDETFGTSVIENLCLEGIYTWKKCEIRLHGRKNRTSNCKVTLIAGGALKEPFYEDLILNGTEDIVLNYDIGEKVPLVVAGYLSNAGVSGGGVDITLTGYYEEKL